MTDDQEEGKEESRGKRRFRRFPIEGTVHLTADRASWKTDLIDISLKGLLVHCPDDWDNSTRTGFRAEIRLEGGVVISMAVTEAHRESDRLGFRCDQIDMDSFTQLKRLVELNLGEPELLNRELAALG
ncbi:MAG: PilZ domain-containing protein [Xanthomonadales bacterium]|nr:PilZ domain-containing protein [Xanthomonadales bacterium]